MPERVTIRTEDLMGILNAYVDQIHGRAKTLETNWKDDPEIRSFTQFRDLEEVFVDCINNLQLAINRHDNWKES